MSECDKQTKARVIDNYTGHNFPLGTVVQFIGTASSWSWFRGKDGNGNVIEQILSRRDYSVIASEKEKEMKGLKNLWVVEASDGEGGTIVVSTAETRAEARVDKSWYNSRLTNANEKARIVKYERGEVIR